MRLFQKCLARLLVVITLFPMVIANVHYINLVKYLFSDYMKEVRPTFDHLEPTQVLLSMSLTAIDDLEEREQILVSSIIIGIGYFDHYLSWNASDFGGIQSLIYPQEHLWLPDLVIDNSVENMGQLGHKEMKVMILSDGKVIWRPKAVLRTTCAIDITYYPFDTQTCSIILSTWMSSSEEVQLDIDWHDNVLLDGYQESGAWELVSTSIENISRKSQQNRISFNFTIKRRKTYYVVNLIVPVIALCATASLVFGLPAEAGEKIGMSITVLLAYAVYLSIISESMPRTSLQVSIMGVYLSILLAATALAVVFTVFVLNLHHKDDSVPLGNRWRYFTIKLRPLLGLHDVTNGAGYESCGNDRFKVKGFSPELKKQSGEKKQHRLMSAFLNSNKVDHANDNNKCKETYHSRTKFDPTIFSASVSKETRVVHNVSWRHVSETADRLLLVVFTTFSAVTSVVFVCFLAFGTP